MLLASALLGGGVGAATWSSHSSAAGHSGSTAPTVTTTTVTVSNSSTSGTVSLSGTVNASALATTTTSSTVAATGAATTTTTTTYSAVSGIAVTGTYTVAGGPATPFHYSFASLSDAASASSARGFTLTATPSAATNSITVVATRTGSPAPLGQLSLVFPNLSSSVTTPAPAIATPVLSPHGQAPLVAAEGSPAPGPTDDVETEAQEAASEAQIAIARCSNQTPPCIANALEAYAAHLERLEPRLPPKLRALPGVIRRAARQVRAAKTAAQAVRAVQAAIVQVNHTVELLHAEDADTQALGQAIGGEAVGVLEAARSKLERATEL